MSIPLRFLESFGASIQAPEKQGVIVNQLKSFNQEVFLLDLMNKAANMQTSAKALTGTYKLDIETMLVEIEALLNTPSGCLSATMLPSHDYQDEATKSAVGLLNFSERKLLENVRLTKSEKFRNYGLGTLAPKLQTQPLRLGLLDEPPYERQSNVQDCVSANFTMIYRDLTGTTIDTATVAKAAFNSSLSTLGKPHKHGTIIDSVDLFRVFETDTLQTTFNWRTKLVPLYGVDFHDISELATRVRKKVPNARIFCSVNLKSLSAKSKDTIHSAILLSSDEYDVTVHDPAYYWNGGGANRQVPITDFAERWAVGYQRGMIVIALPKKSDC